MIVDHDKSLIKLQVLWKSFQTIRSEKELLEGAKDFYNVTLVTAGKSWIQYHESKMKIP
jgi:hypothetical protein